MSKSRGNGGIRHRNEEYNPQKGLVRLIIASGIIVGLVLLSIHIGFAGIVANGIADKMQDHSANTTKTTTMPHAGTESDWRLSLDRNLDAKYTTNRNVRSQEVRAVQIEVLDFVNAQRTEQGIEPLFWNGELSRLNRWYAREIYNIGGGESSHFNQKTDRFIDERAKWAGYPVEQCHNYAEVIITSSYINGPEHGKKNAASITEGWMRSDSHREAILNEQYDVAGVGIFVAKDDTRIAVMTLCDRADIPDEKLNGWEDAKYRGDNVAIPYDVAVEGGEWDATGNLTETPSAETETATRTRTRGKHDRTTAVTDRREVFYAGERTGVHEPDESRVARVAAP